MASDVQVIFESAEKLCDKWNTVINCEDKAFDFIKESMPKVKANQKPILAMQLEQLEKLVLESTVSGDIAQFQPILIPMLRRVTPALLGNEMFGVQPLSTPTGLIYCMRALYSGDENTQLKMNIAQVVVLADASNFSEGGKISSATASGDVVFKEGNKLLVKFASASATKFAVGDEVDNASSFSAKDSEVTSVTTNEALFKHVFKTWTGAHATAVAEQLGLNMKEVGVTIESATATAQERKLKSSFTREMAEDLQSCHGIDAVSLFTQVGSEEIISEMNREFVDYVDAKSVLGGVSVWNYTQADGRWEIEKYQNLCAKIARTSREIAKATRRGQGNFMIVDTATLTALEMSGRLDTVNADPVATSFVGMFNGYIKVFVDLYQENTQIIMGYKGNSEVDAGVFYSPYIPLKITQGVTQDSDQPRLFFRTRYALTDNPFGSEKYFKKIEIQNLPA